MDTDCRWTGQASHQHGEPSENGTAEASRHLRVYLSLNHETLFKNKNLHNIHGENMTFQLSTNRRARFGNVEMRGILSLE